MKEKSKRIIKGALLCVTAVVLATAITALFLYHAYKEYSAPAPDFGSSWTREVLYELDADVYVSTHGSDDGDGTLESPFLTVERAIAAVREIDKTGRDEITVAVTEGEYLVDSLTLTAEDGGGDGCKISYVALGEVTLNAGIRLDGNDFESVLHYPDIANRISDSARDHAVVIDLSSEKYGLTADDWGKLYPIGTYNTASLYSGDTTGPTYSELYINDQRQSLARYPNEGYISVDGVVSAGRDSAEKRQNGDPQGDTLTVSDALGERIAGWEGVEDVWMYGFYMYDWADGSTPIREFDREKNELTTEYYSFFGVKEGARYYVYNCLEELDSEGEWYLDRERGLLTVYAPDGIKSSDVIFSTSISPLISIRCDNVSLEGFTLQGSRAGGVDAVGNGIEVNRCTVKNVSGTAIYTEGYGNTVSCCEIYSIGQGGIEVLGGDRATLTPGNNTVENNLIHDWAQIYKTYRPGISLGGVGNVCRNNELYSAPHLGITYSGNDHTIEYNLIHGVCLESDDAGAIYTGKSYTSYGNEIRYNCIYDIGDGNFTPNGIYMDDAISGQKIYGNLLVNIPGSALFIGGGRDMEIYDNVIVNSGDAPIFYDARAREAVLSNTWFTGDIDALLDDLGVSPWMSDIWRRAYPKYERIMGDKVSIDSPDCVLNPAGSIIKNNVVFHKALSVGDINDYVKEHGDVADNHVYHLSLLWLAFEDLEGGGYVFRWDGMPEILTDKIGRY